MFDILDLDLNQNKLLKYQQTKELIKKTHEVYPLSTIEIRELLAFSYELNHKMKERIEFLTQVVTNLENEKELEKF